jgi:hypothetical protein
LRAKLSEEKAIISPTGTAISMAIEHLLEQGGDKETASLILEATA